MVVCNTCRSPRGCCDDAEGRTDGAKLADQLRRVQATQANYSGVAIQEMPCLFACSEACTVHLRAPGKVGYVLGRFEPDEADARAILDYAAAYARSEWGEVAFEDWPEGVKGHFITRNPPDGYVAR